MADAGSASEELRRKLSLQEKQKETLEEVAKDFPFWTRSELEGYKSKFAEYDEDNSGDLDFFEVQKMMEKLGKTMTHLELKEMIREVDKDMDGKVSFREFLMAMTPPEFRHESEDQPVSLFGRIAQSGLAGRAKFFEEQIRAQRSKTDEEVRAEIRAEAAKRKLERQRKKEEEEERKKREEEEAARAVRRAKMADRIAMFNK